MKHMTILAVHVGPRASAALLKDGKVLGIASEEWFTRAKAQSGLPRHSMRWLMKRFDVVDLTEVAVCGWHLAGSDEGILSRLYGKIRPSQEEVRNDPFSDGDKGIVNSLWKEFKIPDKKIRFIEDHACHAYGAYYGLSERRERSLVLTLDKEGDGLCATASVAQGFDFKRKAQTSREHSIGHIYASAASHLGMSPAQMMHVAGYAKPSRRLLDSIIKVDKANLTFQVAFSFDKWLDEDSQGIRFDQLASTVQALTEDVVKQWVLACVRKTKATDLYLGGGMFMNSRLCRAIAELDDVTSVKVLPSAGDNGNPVGAAYCSYIRICKRHGIEPQVEPLESPYLGIEDDTEPILKKLRKNHDAERADPRLIAQVLAKGEVIVLHSGRMEWGPRSLGNRCIIANPSNMACPHDIRDQLGLKDFWSPFGAAVLEENQDEYISKSKADRSSMAVASIPIARKELRACTHPGDSVIEPMVIERGMNPQFYDIIKQFELVTGIGAVLIANFSLPGKPIVASSADAEEAFENSGLRHMVMGDYLVSKR